MPVLGSQLQGLMGAEAASINAVVSHGCQDSFS